MIERQVTFYLDIGYVGARKQETRTFEFDDGTPPEAQEAEIDEVLEEWKDQEVSYWHEDAPAARRRP